MKWKERLTLELERLRRHNLQQLHPLQQLFWESTLRCNVHCLHCGSDCLSSVTTPDMPAKDFLRVIDKSITPHVNPHSVIIIISGGEPLMRKDLAYVGAELNKRGYPWGMVTNGLALTDDKFKQLREAGLTSMSISLDGLKDDHIWLRQHPQAFEGAKHAISLAVSDKELVWDVVTCVNQHNISHLDAIRDQLWSWGVRDWRLITIDPMGRAEHNPELLLSGEQLNHVLQFIQYNRQQGKHVSYSCEGFLGDYEGKVRDHLFHCAAGISVASILIDGSISACTSIRGKYYQGNIYHDDFWDVWENGFQKYRNRNWMRQISPCKECHMFRYCEGNGMHLRREDGSLMLCHYNQIYPKQRAY